MKKSLWRFSAKDSAIEFKIKYYTVSNMKGYFTGFWGNVTASESFTDADVSVMIETASINANHERRNKELKSSGCLHAAKFLTIEFAAIGGCKRSDGNIREITGLLTIKNVTSEVTLVVNYSTVKKGPQGPVMAFGLFGCISRKDFNLGTEHDRLDDHIYMTARIELSKVF